MIVGLCESPLTFQAIIIWRDELNEGKVFLRDIIDLEATYAGPDAKAMPAPVIGPDGQPIVAAPAAPPAAPAAATRSRERASAAMARLRPAKAISSTTIWRTGCRERALPLIDDGRHVRAGEDRGSPKRCATDQCCPRPRRASISSY
jgi:hypothetical protein